MRKEAIIHVTSSQNYDDGTEDRMEFYTTGTYYKKGGAYYVLYRESQVTGMEGVTTALRAEQDKLVLNRMGAVDYKQAFEEGVLHRAAYVTAMGLFNLSVYTENLLISLTEYGGHITLKYDLYSDDGFVSKNALGITIKEDAPR